MNQEKLKNLGIIISKYFYEGSYSLNDAANAIKLEFSTINFDEILNAGKIYAQTQSGNNKNISVFIIIFAMYILNVDDTEELQNNIKKQDLTGELFGGTIILLRGESQRLSLKTNIRPNNNKDNLVYIKKGIGLEPVKSIILANFFEMLFHLNGERIESLILNDESEILLALIVNDYLSVELPERLEEKILSGVNDFKKDSILYIKYKPVEKILREILKIERDVEVFSAAKLNNSNFKKLEKELGESYADFESRLEYLPAYEQVSFIINLLLPPSKPFPFSIILKLFEDDLFEAFIQVFKEKLSHFYHILELVLGGINQNQEKLSKEQKDSLESTIVALQIDYIKNDHLQNIENNLSLIEFISDFLSAENKITLIQELTSIQEKLMSNELDRLIRYEFYIKDSLKDEYITKLIRILSRTNK